jgi:hypothetical protein
MTAPDGFTIFKDEPLLSKENGKDVQMHFQRLNDAILHTRGDGGDKAECNTSTTENSAIGAMNRVGRDSSTAAIGRLPNTGNTNRCSRRRTPPSNASPPTASPARRIGARARARLFS